MKSEPLHRLIHRHLDGRATPEEVSQLALQLVGDPRAAQIFAQATRLDAGLRVCFQEEVVGRQLGHAVCRHPTSDRRTAPARWAAAAAAVLLGVLSLWWWRPWDRASVMLAADDARLGESAPRRVTHVPVPPPSAKQPGALSPAAREVKRLASRYWLPDGIQFSDTPLAEAVAEVQRQAVTVNHRQNAIVAHFAVDIPEDATALPVTASRADLPLHAWLELLSAQAGCVLRYTDSGVAFDPVSDPERVESREWALAVRMDEADAAGATTPLFSYAHPWESEPDFRSVPAHGTTLATAWRIPISEAARVRVRDGRTVEARHTRRELRRLEAMLAVAQADAGRPTITFRAKETALPAPTPVVVWQGNSTIYGFGEAVLSSTDTAEFGSAIHYGSSVASFTAHGTAVSSQAESTLSADSYAIDLTLALEGVAFDGIINGRATPTLALPSITTENSNTYGGRVIQVLNAQPAGGSHVVSMDDATQMIQPPQGHFLSNEAPPELADPWLVAGTATAQLGQSAWLATQAPPPAELATEDSRMSTQSDRQNLYLSGFILLDLPRSPPLQTTARLEGELLKLSGTYTPPDGSGIPTDFQAYVAEGQAFILQTEDVAAQPSGSLVHLGKAARSGYQPVHSASSKPALSPAESSMQATAGDFLSYQPHPHNDAYAIATDFVFIEPDVSGASVKGVAISASLHWR